MKYKSLTIYDSTEKKFGEYHFSDYNLILGQNKTGKSSLVKSILYALGCNIKQWDSKFNYKHYYYKIIVENDNKEIFIIERIGDYFKVNNELTMNSEEFRLFANEKIFNIPFKMITKTENEIIPYVYDYLMYYNTDQDYSWTNKLFFETHKNAGMYKIGELSKVLEYLLGTIDIEVDRLKIEISHLKKQKLKLSEKYKHYKELLVILVEKQNSSEKTLSITQEDFEQIINHYKEELKQLYVVEQNYKEKYYKTYKAKVEIEDVVASLKQSKKYLRNLNKKLERESCEICDSKLTVEKFLKSIKVNYEENSVNKALIDKKKAESDIQKDFEQLQVEYENIIISINKLEQKLKQNEKMQENAVQSYLEYISYSKNNILIKETLREVNEDIVDLDMSIKQLKKEQRQRQNELKSKRDTSVKIYNNLIVDYYKKVKQLKRLEKIEKYDDLVKGFTIQKTGSDKNIHVLIRYLAYFSILDNIGLYKFPFIIDTIIKDEIELKSREHMYDLINYFVETTKNQKFITKVTSVEAESTKGVNGKNANVIEIKSTICFDTNPKKLSEIQKCVSHFYQV